MSHPVHAVHAAPLAPASGLPAPSGSWADRPLARLVVAAAVVWHLLAAFGPPAQPPPANTEGRDFASYFYAARVALAGGDPYDKAALDAAASADGTRAEVHPYFYPPPFLWLVGWAAPVPLARAFVAWKIFGELALLAAAVSLARWWRPFGAEVVPIVAAFGALMYGVAYSVELGQANFPVLLLIVLGLSVERRAPALGGVFVGLAAMMKMSPALFVLWWLLRGRNTAVLAAVATAIVTSVLSLPLLSLAHQLEFYTRVLPTLGSGDYNGLTIKIEMFGNHSFPNLWHQYFPSGANQLSPMARGLSLVTTVGLIGATGFAFRRKTDDELRIAAQACAVLVVMLLVPVYTYEHHLVFALPAMILGALAVLRGWLGRGWGVALALAIPVMLYDLPAIRQLALRVVTTQHPALYFWLQEAKMVALITVGLAMVRLGGTAFEDPSRAPVPAPVG
ncbi:MAG: glycosyltransferase family 87 protein [Myxococcota bacterium]